MKYLETFRLPSEAEEMEYIFSFPYQLEMSCFSDNVYPFKVFTRRICDKLLFEPITIFSGGNGSGKSTLLNIISEKLKVQRSAPFNNTPYYTDFLELCKFESFRDERIPKGSRIITSDDVFDYLLNIRSINEGVDRKRSDLFREYFETKDRLHQNMKTLDDYEEFKRIHETKRNTTNKYVVKRLGIKNFSGKSNGESAYLFFTNAIEENALYLLDEPENSLSPVLQDKLASFIEDTVRFYGCQFIISTHSPFMLALKGAKIYDLDSEKVEAKDWTELENIRFCHDFFAKHSDKFSD